MSKAELSSRRASLQTSHPAGLYPDHGPAFGTGELQGGRHHSVKTGQSGPTPNNGDAPLDQVVGLPLERLGQDPSSGS